MGKRSLHLVVLLAGSAIFAAGQPPSFPEQVYPILEKAGCRNCHNVDGVASATRLHFPSEDADTRRIEAFGNSLIEFVDRQVPDKSLLLLKPTLRVAHTGGERIRKGSADEATLQAWISHLAELSGPKLTEAMRYRQTEARGYGLASRVVLRRLTHSQYNNSVRDLLKDATDPASRFPPEDFVNGFKNQYSNLSISPILADAYSRAAERLAANAFRRGDSRGLIPCSPAAGDDGPCRTKFIETLALRAFRRPPEPEEIALHTQIFKAEKTFLAGAQAVIETMLQSPSFLFWLEETPNPKWKSFAKASRLSYFIWNTTPDDDLLARAARGELDTPDGMERVARRMLEDAKAKDGLDEFVSEWLRFDRVMDASRERRIYPLFNQELARSMTVEARRFLADLVLNDRNFMDAFTATYSFINSDLAAVYKTPPPARDFDRVEFSAESERAGLMGQALFLTLSSKPDDTGPTGRGLFIREQFLCQQVPPPPPGVDTNLPPVAESKPVTNRERMAMHATNQMCATCHNLIDPIGFGFEKFDAIGMRREKHKLVFYPNVGGGAGRRAKPNEIELDLDTRGRVAGIQGSEFSSPAQLGAILARSPQCQECMVKQVFRYMAGRLETPADRPVINRSLEAFRASNFHLKELMVALLKSSAFPDTGRVVSVADHH